MGKMRLSEFVASARDGVWLVIATLLFIPAIVFIEINDFVLKIGTKRRKQDVS